MTSELVHPPETLEGWYALHQIYRARGGSRVDHAAFIEDLALSALSAANAELSEAAESGSGESRPGWTRVARLIGSSNDLMVVHFRSSLDAIARAQNCILGTALAAMDTSYSFLSVTEAG